MDASIVEKAKRGLTLRHELPSGRSHAGMYTVLRDYRELSDINQGLNDV
jgi:hypothetical protein